MPRLYVVPTPIGNLEDITLRALRILREVGLVLAEDTRQTRKLFARYSIATPLQSYHQHNKQARIAPVLAELQTRDVALVSNAGMPAISDPGFELIRAAVDAGVEVDVLPGPNAVITAVVAAALPAPGFLFVGFLPRRAPERRRRLQEVRDLPFSLVVYEAPHRLAALLTDLAALFDDRPAVLARELSKVHQEVVRAALPDLLAHIQEHPPRGECTLVVAGAPPSVATPDEALRELRARRAAGENRRDAIAAVARTYRVGRNELYRAWLDEGLVDEG